MFHRVSARALAALASLALAAAANSACALDVAADKAAAGAEFARNWPQLKAMYEDIHSHPELGFQETRTAALLAAKMRSLGFSVTEHVGGTGLVAIYHNGPGPVVMVRTELDALPLEEKTGLPFASRAKQTWNGRETFVDHACGHDIHMAAWVGTAEALLAMKDRWHGTLMFIGQPAEEIVGGARAMIKDGLFTRFQKPDYGFAQHVGAEPYGTIEYKAGVYSSNADGFTLTFHGRGGHGSKPAATIDPVMMAARFVVDVQSVISREKDPAAFGVVTVGALQAGSAGNIIPDQAIVRGTIRSFTPDVRAHLKAGVERTADAVAVMAGAPKPTLEFDDGATAVVNDTGLAARTGPVFKAAFGDSAVEMPAPQSASEDYSEFIEAGVPSLYFSLGGYDPALIARARAGGPPVPVNHSPEFAPTPEPSIRTGVEAMSLAVLSVLGT
ncbi:MAG TPA: amidohydrolase [Caulobacteraceae bacterium]|jgi:hippurate hydrolase|nr:amidohydrolase [Caulobacteraceae bacterium]